jgi:DNA repair protein RecN (Recombination protein N)
MLKSLSIKNVALIENAEIDFQSGLNILSGETGAGKSVILDSLNFAFGAKADKTMIRRGADFSSVKAVFEIDDESIFSILKENDIEPENTLIISRKFSQSGSGEVKINGESIPVSVLKKITSKKGEVQLQQT